MPRHGGHDYLDDYDDGYDDYEYEEEEVDEISHEFREATEQAASAPSAQAASLSQDALHEGNGTAPARDGAGTLQQEATPPVWRCPACTFDNPSSFLQCEICGFARPHTGRASQPPARDHHQSTKAHSKHSVHAVSALGQMLCDPPLPGPQKQLPPDLAPLRDHLKHISSQETLAQKKTGAGKGTNAIAIADRARAEPFAKALYGPEYSSLDAFSFDTASPDDAVRAAQAKGLSKPNKASASAASANKGKGKATEIPKKSATTASQKSADTKQTKPGASKKDMPATREAEDQSRVEEAEDALGSLELQGRHAKSAQKGNSGKATAELSRRPLSEYKAEKWILDSAKLPDYEKPTVHLVVIGHVDAGKSTLTGHLLHSLGQVSDKEMHRNRRESAEKGKASFAYAWVLDEGSEERERGVTMSLATAQMETQKLHVKLLDAPGHRDFVPSMISGASQADAAVLVIDATPGAFEAGLEGTGVRGGKGQTWEHMQLARSCGVEQLIVAVNKMDTVQYSKAVFDHIKATLSPLLKQLGYKESSVICLPLSGLDGENLDKRATNKDLASWYTGPSLLEAIDSLSSPARDLSHPLRLPVAEVILKGSRVLGATAVAGRIEAGGLKQGLKVVVMPGAYQATVKALEVSGQLSKVAVAGGSVDVGLTGLDVSVLFPGAVLCHPDYPVREVRRFEARILTLESPIPLLRGAQVILHVHAARESAVVTRLEALLDSKTGEVSKKKPRAIPSNSSALIEITTERVVCLELFQEYRALGRIALRDSGRSVAVGIVTKILDDP